MLDRSIMAEIDPVRRLRWRHEAARALGVTEKTLADWAAKGKGDLLPTGYLDRHIMIYSDKAIELAQKKRAHKQAQETQKTEG